MKKYLSLSLLLFPFMAHAQTGAMITALMAIVPPCYTLNTNWAPKQSNLVALWNFNGTVGSITSGTTLASGNSGPTATTVGTVSYVSAFNTNYSQALQLSSTSGNYVNVGTPTALNDLKATGMTISMWINIPAFTSSSSYGKFILNKSVNSTYGWMLLYDNNMLYFQAVSSGNMKKQTLNVASIAGVWTHLVVTWDGTLAASGTHIYLNGTEVASYNYTQDGSGTPTSDASEALTIGKAGSASGFTAQNSDAIIDDLAIWNTQFTAGEVRSLYQNQSCN